MSTSASVRRGLRGLPRQVAALAVAALFLLPIALLVSMSLRPIGRPLTRHLEGIPRPLAWENYSTVFELIDIWRMAGNSLFVVALAVPLTIVFSSWAGFAIAQLPAVWRLRLLALSFAMMMVPLTALWLPRFLLFKEVGLIDSRFALIVPSLGGTSPFYVLLFLWTFRRLPPGLAEAARLDGAGPFRIWAEIAMPLARPTIVAVGTLAFVRYWGNFIDPLLYIRSTDKMTLPYGIELLHQMDRTNWSLLMAGSVLVVLPVALVFLLSHRAFLQQFRETGWLS